MQMRLAVSIMAVGVGTLAWGFMRHLQHYRGIAQAPTPPVTAKFLVYELLDLGISCLVPALVMLALGVGLYLVLGRPTA